jgi:glucose/arabinose dehydrogenase
MSGYTTSTKTCSLIILMTSAFAALLAGPANTNAQGTPGTKERDQATGGLTLPPGFRASVFADNLGRARHLTVAPSGDVYVNTWSSSYTDLKNAPGGYIVALRDTNRDGKADEVKRFGTVHQDGKAGGGTGIAVHRDALYVEDNGKIVRYQLEKGSLVPKGNPETVLSGLSTERGHIMHPFATRRTEAFT